MFVDLHIFIYLCIRKIFASKILKEWIPENTWKLESIVDLLLSFFDTEKEQHFIIEPIPASYGNFKTLEYLFVCVWLVWQHCLFIWKVNIDVSQVASWNKILLLKIIASKWDLGQKIVTHLNNVMITCTVIITYTVIM